jgi:hypothetical protein
VLALALLLAFPLRELFQRTVIVPLAYFLWTLALFYRTMPQLVWWVLAVLIASLLVVGSLAPGERFAQRAVPGRPASQGQVEGLAEYILKAPQGVYFRWLVANRLGKLAHRMLVQREGDKSRSVFAPLVGADWQPSPRLRQYLETGLHGSFAEFPKSDRARSTDSPLDLDIDEAVTFLESQLEQRRDRHR